MLDTLDSWRCTVDNDFLLQARAPSWNDAGQSSDLRTRSVDGIGTDTDKEVQGLYELRHQKHLTYPTGKSRFDPDCPSPERSFYLTWCDVQSRGPRRVAFLPQFPKSRLVAKISHGACRSRACDALLYGWAGPVQAHVWGQIPRNGPSLARSPRSATIRCDRSTPPLLFDSSPPLCCP